MAERVTREELAESINMMRTALNRIIEMNVQYAVDLHGDASKAESMACVKVCRGTLSAVDHILSRLDAEQGQEQHCELFTTKRGEMQDCMSDGHYECRACSRLDPDSDIARLDAEREQEGGSHE